LHGRVSGRDPLRLVLDADLRLPETATMLQQDSSAQTWVFCAHGADKLKRSKLEGAGAKVKTVPVSSKGRLDLEAVLTELGRNRITTVLVEGGSKVHGSFLQANLVDQVLLFVAPVFLGDQGVPLASFPGKNSVEILSQMKIMSTKRYGDDVLIDGRFNQKT
jgi:diaminohydroxyphosphoribosylaminopyrimidine deaminase/5-amino-6-(5-phosphoribosylamino)uracil reductase